MSKIEKSLPPPSELPSFAMQKTSEDGQSTTGSQKEQLKPATSEMKHSDDDPIPQQNPNFAAQDVSSDISAALSPITEGVKNSIFYNWMKDTVRSGAEKAKASIDKVVTTLDPQMSALVYSGGSTEVIVACYSDDDDEVMAIREAFQKIYGRATVYGHHTDVSTVAVQPIGFVSAELFAKERINLLRSNENFVDKVLCAICHFLVEIYTDQ